MIQWNSTTYESLEVETELTENSCKISRKQKALGAVACFGAICV